MDTKKVPVRHLREFYTPVLEPMRFVIDVTELSLAELLDLLDEAFVGMVEMDADSFQMFFSYVQARQALVIQLEKTLI